MLHLYVQPCVLSSILQKAEQNRINAAALVGPVVQSDMQTLAR